MLVTGRKDTRSDELVKEVDPAFSTQTPCVQMRIQADHRFEAHFGMQRSNAGNRQLNRTVDASVDERGLIILRSCGQNVYLQAREQNKLRATLRTCILSMTLHALQCNCTLHARQYCKISACHRFDCLSLVS